MTGWGCEQKEGEKQGPRSGGLQNSGGGCRFKRHLGHKLTSIITDIKDAGLQMSRRQLEKRAESAEMAPGRPRKDGNCLKLPSNEVKYCIIILLFLRTALAVCNTSTLRKRDSESLM